MPGNASASYRLEALPRPTTASSSPALTSPSHGALWKLRARPVASLVASINGAASVRSRLQVNVLFRRHVEMEVVSVIGVRRPQ